MSVEALRPTRVRLQLTPSGRTASMLMIAGLVATAPFGSNLALFPACLLAALALSAFLAWFGVRRLRIVPPGSRVVRTGAPFEFPLGVAHAGWGPGVRDVLVFATADGPPTSRVIAYVDELAPRATRETSCEWRTRRRGRRESLALRMVSSFPIGLCEASAYFDAPIDWLSLPRAARIAVELDDAARRARAGALSNRRRGDDEFYALRDARSGDSPHWIHWRSSARRGKPVVREMRGELTPEKHVVLFEATDLALNASGTNDAFEHAVSLAAAIVERHSRRGELVRFTFEGSTPWSVSVAPTRSSLQSLLSRLAEVRCTRATPSGPSLPALRARWNRADVVLVHACSASIGAQARIVWAAHGAVVERRSHVPARRAVGGLR